MTVQKNGITEGVIWQQILLFFFPILFGTFFQQLYNTADAIIVGRFVGKEALSAVGGTTGTLINLLVGFFVGMSSGSSVVVSQYYGARNAEMVKKSVHTAFCLAIGGGVCLMIIGELVAPLAIRAMGTPEEIVNHSVTYIRIYFLGVIGNLLYNMGAAILRAVGDSKKPLFFLICACLTNIVLDILFVVSNSFVQISNQSFDVDAVSSSALFQGFETSSHATYAAETVFSKNLQNFRMILNSFNDAGIFSNHSIKLLCDLLDLISLQHYSISRQSCQIS